MRKGGAGPRTARFGRRGGRIEREGMGCYLPAHTVLCTVGTLRRQLSALAAIEKGVNALTVEIFLIIVKFILRSICELNFAKVYERHNIFDKKSQYMIFHVL